MAEPTRTEIDGVPVFHADSDRPLTAGIVFGVGQAHETLTTRGITHLVEHLALGPLTSEHRRCNGWVGLTLTGFEVEGDPGEVRDFFYGATRALAALPFERLDAERRVLRTEDQRHGASLGALAHGLRFGPKTYGLVNSAELGLYEATPETTDAWRARHFTRGNAAVWLSGPPPEGLDLSALPEGERMPPPAPEPYPYRYPAWYPGGDAYVAVSLLAPRTTPLWVAGAILRERLYERLRTAEGRSYEVSVGYDPLTATDAEILLVTDTLPEEAESVRDAVLVEMTKLARSGATPEELEDVRERRRRATGDPRFEVSQAEQYAVQTVLGGDPVAVDDLDRELEAVDGAAVGTALRDAIDSALWLVPGAIGVHDRRIHALPGASDSRVDGRAYPRAPGVPDEIADDVLYLGAQGVSEEQPNGAVITVTFDACQAVQVFDDGARVLWGDDSIRLFVHPAIWTDGDHAVATIDELADPALVVRMGEESGYEPPIDPAKAKAESGGLLKRLRRRS